MFQRKHQILLCILISSIFTSMTVIFLKPFATSDFSKPGGTSGAGILEIVFLGLVQGTTEWFPVSSTGHLVIVQELLRINVTVAFVIMIHLGTLIGVILFLRRDLQPIFAAVFKLNFSGLEGRMVMYTVIGTIPIALAGFLFKNVFESMFRSLLLTGVAMLFNGLILYWTRSAKPRKKLCALDSLLIGVSQAFAIIPGISRMGVTISTALLRGVEKDEAYRFSLLLSIPSIIGGCIVMIQDVNFERESLTIILGVLVSALIGYLALRTVRKYVVKQEFYKFAYYCLLMGVLILFLSI